VNRQRRQRLERLESRLTAGETTRVEEARLEQVIREIGALEARRRERIDEPMDSEKRRRGRETLNELIERKRIEKGLGGRCYWAFALQ
jgi:hypothetical protein